MKLNGLVADALLIWISIALVLMASSVANVVAAEPNPDLSRDTIPPCRCGDANGDTHFDISDPVFLIAFIFGGNPPNPICQSDADGSGSVDISDAVFLIDYIFNHGPAPHCPH